MNPKPLRANPGGQLASSDIVGRDEFIRTLWTILERQSLVLNAERRIGKTSIIKKMRESPHNGQICIYQDLEGVHSMSEFARVVFHETKQYLTSYQRGMLHIRELISRFGGADVGGFRLPESAALPWKDILISTLTDIAAMDGQPRMILFWDELPLMLHNIKKREGEAMVMEALDTLRSLRHSLPSLRMVFTGSIGIHNVISSLKKSGYANDPLNDMRNIIVQPLAPADGEDLAHRLILGEGLDCCEPQITARELARAVDDVPFYIHHVVADLCGNGQRRIDPSIVREVIFQALVNPLDCWHMNHYRTRLNQYYEPMERDLALDLLDDIAASPQSLTLHELFARIKARRVFDDLEAVRAVLSLLERDHYIIRTAENTYRFTFPLIGQWWRFHRGL